MDTPQRYGLVSRALHWGMAALFAWQFTGMAVRILVGRHPVTAFMVGSHAGMGTLLLILVLLRGAWGLANARRRPPRDVGLIGRLAQLGHLALYALMFIVPSLALMRAYGSGRAFAPFGIPLFPGFEGGPVSWMTAPANAAHGLLAWTLLALVAGHVAMVIVHRVIWRDDVLHRMAGRAPKQAPSPAE
ncbi:Nickel-dependent hydrogenase B-type cytochrome subunit [Acetobacteraceae bacterium AT-5844]|nr:Nickel-dependent hydrogenase B-type cytochrome subunit [Acetobacteraceae bacterium AT-5844]